MKKEFEKRVKEFKNKNNFLKSDQVKSTILDNGLIEYQIGAYLFWVVEHFSEDEIKTLVELPDVLLKYLFKLQNIKFSNLKKDYKRCGKNGNR